jgi:hypothetical protein
MPRALLLAGLVLLAGCAVAPGTPDDPEGTMTFAVIGDYGNGSAAEKAVSEMVHGWKPDFIVTAGDNNYPEGSAGTIDTNIGGFYSDYIADYRGGFGSGALENRFYPATGNHDWEDENLEAYLNYFTLPDSERYYTVRRGDVALFILDSDPRDPDGTDAGSVQAEWTRNAMEQSDAKWKFVFFHHPPYSSCSVHKPSTWMRWPFKEWGADAVFTGHCHTYERLEIDGLPYFINGLGGASKYDFGPAADGSLVRYAAAHGAQRVRVRDDSVVVEFFSLEDTSRPFDTIELR